MLFERESLSQHEMAGWREKSPFLFTCVGRQAGSLHPLRAFLASARAQTSLFESPLHISMTDFLALVAALMSNDNATRKQAEAAYASYKTENPQALVLQLVQLLRSEQDAEARAFAPVLLRPLVEVKAGVYDKLEQQAQLTLKAQLLEAVAVEPVAHIRRKIGHLIAEVASVSLKFGQQWPELLSVVSTLTAHGDALMRETAFDLLAKLAEYVGELLAPHKQEFLTLFTNSLNDASGEVQIASLKAASSFLLTLEDREELVAFAIIINPMLRVRFRCHACQCLFLYHRRAHGRIRCGCCCCCCCSPIDHRSVAQGGRRSHFPRSAVRVGASRRAAPKVFPQQLGRRRSRHGVHLVHAGFRLGHA